MKYSLYVVLVLLSINYVAGSEVELIVNANGLSADFTNYTLIAADKNLEEFESSNYWIPIGQNGVLNVSNITGLTYVYLKKQVTFGNETIELTIRNNRGGIVTVLNSTLFIGEKNHTNLSSSSLPKEPDPLDNELNVSFEVNISNNGSNVMLRVFYEYESAVNVFEENMTLYQQATGSPHILVTLLENETTVDVTTSLQLESEKAYIKQEDDTANITIYAEFLSSLKNSGDPTLLDFINYSMNVSGNVSWYRFPKINVSTTNISMAKNWADESLSTFRIDSLGNTDLTVAFSLTDQNFTLTSYDITIPGESYKIITLNFTPSNPGLFYSTLTLRTNDMKNEEINITLFGNATAPRFNTTFEDLYFETKTSYEFTMVINNTGDGQLKITRIKKPWWIVLNVTATAQSPIIIGVNESLSILLRTYFRTEPNDIYSGLLEFSTNDPNNETYTYNITVKWMGAPKEEKEEQFSIYIIIAIVGSTVAAFAILGVKAYKSGMDRKKLMTILFGLLVVILMILSAVAQVL